MKLVVELRLSLCYHYQYSRISKVISSLYKKKTTHNNDLELKREFHF